MLDELVMIYRGGQLGCDGPGCFGGSRQQVIKHPRALVSIEPGYGNQSWQGVSFPGEQSRSYRASR